MANLSTNETKLLAKNNLNDIHMNYCHLQTSEIFELKPFPCFSAASSTMDMQKQYFLWVLLYRKNVLFLPL